jgi:hypothetical protein
MRRFLAGQAAPASSNGVTLIDGTRLGHVPPPAAGHFLRRYCSAFPKEKDAMLARRFRSVLIVLAVCAPALVGGMLAAPPAAADAHGHTALPYTPGLGELMSANQMRHAKLWFAGQAGNWPLAAYELDELREGFADVLAYQPHFKGKPIDKLLKPMTEPALAGLEAAIAAKDRARFEAAFDDLSHACSSCHQDLGYGFIAIQRPTAPPFSNQRFEAVQP